MLAAEVSALNAEITRLRTVAEQPPSLPPAAGCPPVEYLYLDSITSDPTTSGITQSRHADDVGDSYREPLIGWMIAATALFLAGATCCLVAISSAKCCRGRREVTESSTQTDPPSSSPHTVANVDAAGVDVVVPRLGQEVSEPHAQALRANTSTSHCSAASLLMQRERRMEVVRPHDLPAALALSTTGCSPEIVVLPRGTPPRKLTPHGRVSSPPTQAVVFI